MFPELIATGIRCKVASSTGDTFMATRDQLRTRKLLGDIVAVAKGTSLVRP